MAEYIERGKLLSDVDAAMENAGMEYVFGQVMKRYIKRVPSADVTKVRHGIWLYWDELHGGNTPAKNVLGVFCSECKRQSDSKTHFCPNCGAKMDGEQ